MVRQICLFEDAGYANLLPLVYFRPVYNLKCGILSLREKVARTYPKAELTLHCRSYLADYLRLRNRGLRVNEIGNGPYFFLNGRVLVDEAFVKKISGHDGKDCVFVQGNDVIGAMVSGGNLSRFREGIWDTLSLAQFDHLPQVEIQAQLISYSWNLVQHNGTELRRDFAYFVKNKRGKKKPGLIF